MNCKPWITLLGITFLSTTSYSLCAADPAGSGPTPLPVETPQQREARVKWWRTGRLGMFIHWGPVSLKGTEISWSRANSNTNCPNRGPIPVEVYDNLYREFNPTNFNARDWARLAKRAGMKYMVLTAKHCDGFLLWRSQVDNYNISRTPFGRDICAELAQAARKEGLKIGWYFSPMDWRDPDFRTEKNALFLGRMQKELCELLGNYGRIDLLWFDWDGGDALYEQPQTYRIVRNLQPGIVLNNRLDLGKGSSDRKILSRAADYYTPEQQLGGYDDQQPWETCMTLGTQWAWKPNDNIKTVAETIRILINCAGGDGNLLLNVGPMPDGRIEPRQAEVLTGLGDWLRKYGHSIFGTRGGPFKPGQYGASTRAGSSIYLHITDWLADRLKLPPLPAIVRRARLLTGGSVQLLQTDGGIEIGVPEANRQPMDTIVALELDRDAQQLKPLDVPTPVSLASRAKATASNVYQAQTEFGPDKAVDGKADTRWATDAGLHQGWLELDLGKPATFSRVRISEAFPNRVQKFELQRFEDGMWKRICAATTLGERWTRRFETVTAQRVRLNITEASDGPTIWEFQLFQ